jgi:hypothetical protein
VPLGGGIQRIYDDIRYWWDSTDMVLYGSTTRTLSTLATGYTWSPLTYYSTLTTIGGLKPTHLLYYTNYTAYNWSHRLAFTYSTTPATLGAHSPTVLQYYTGYTWSRQPTSPSPPLPLPSPLTLSLYRLERALDRMGSYLWGVCNGWLVMCAGCV